MEAPAPFLLESLDSINGNQSSILMTLRYKLIHKYGSKSMDSVWRISVVTMERAFTTLLFFIDQYQVLKENNRIHKLVVEVLQVLSDSSGNELF